LPVRVYTDEEEWTSEPYVRGDGVLHIKLRKWADILLIAPCSANTLAKLSNGICDNLLVNKKNSKD
jgi:phosphopantothenoylcysteine decarboxylase